MAKAKARSTTPKVTYFDPHKVPEEQFGLTVRGDCMSPEIPDGTNIVVHRDIMPKAGELAVVFFKPEVVRAGGLQAVVKRLVTNVPPFWKPGKPIKRPADSISNISPCLIVEDARKRVYVYDLEHVLGVFKASLPSENVRFTTNKLPKSAVLKQSKRRAA